VGNKDDPEMSKFVEGVPPEERRKLARNAALARWRKRGK